MSGKSHEHLCTEGANQGEPAWLMLVETGDGKFFLEDEFGDWDGNGKVNTKGVWPPLSPQFSTRAEALETAAVLICDEFGGEPSEWLKK
jgi:hypothetical protein